MKPSKFLALLSSILCFEIVACAAPVDSDTAAATVKGWLSSEASPLGARLGGQVANVETYKDNIGSPLYYAVNLKPSGFVIVAADDQVEPIIAFASAGRFDQSEKNPLGALVSRDLPRRLARADKLANAAAGLKNQAKWEMLQQALLGAKNSGSSKSLTTGSITDLRIAPFIQSAWGQATVPAFNGVACYNFFTPPHGAGNPTNVVCGCVATALAQLMYFYQYPHSGVGTGSFAVSFDGNSMTRQLRGGDGFGGPYQWGNMPPVPSSPTLQQCGAIGALTYDAGVAVHMQYTDTASGSGAYLSDAKNALVTTFKFGNAVLTEAFSINVGFDLNGMINANLDAHLPVVFGIDNSVGGHCIVCDGYGYSYATLYHHLNMGWDGLDNAWYQLPVIDLTDTVPYYNFNACIYNVFTNGAGEIISGRVLDPKGNPLANASVTAVSTKGGVYTAKTDLNGIYALPGVPSAATCVVTVTNGGYFPATSNFVTGVSSDYATNTGNLWGANFTLVPAQGPPVFTIQPANQIVTLGSNATFTANAAGQLPLGYQWQYQPSGSIYWLNLTDDGTNSGSQTSTLTISQTTLAMSGEPIRCVATNSQGLAVSLPATLTVNPAPFIFVSSLAGFAGGNGSVDGLNTNTLFNSPHGIAVDSRTNIFVTDKNNHTIRELSPSVSGWSVSTIAGLAGNYGSANGLGTNAQFNGPYGIAVDGSGHLFVADTANHLIRELTLSGTNYLASTIAGTAGAKGSTDGLNALFNLPMGIALDNSGNLYVADEGNHNIRKLTPAGNNWMVSTIAGSGAYGSNDGTNNNAQFGQPYGITVNGSGTVFVADEYNHTIRQLTPIGANWVVSTIAGKSGVAGSADGGGSVARFKYPTGIAADANGNLYVADNGNNTIRRLTLVGTNWMVFTVAGQAGSAGSVDGVGAGVRLNGPFGVAVNNGTNVYLSDSINNTIRGVPLPSIAAPPLVSLVKQFSQNSLTLTWSAKAGQTYLVQSKTNLSQAVWNNFTTITASNWTGAASVQITADPQRFYRVVPTP